MSKILKAHALLGYMFAGLFTTCILEGWMNPTSILTWVLLGVLFSRIMKLSMPYAHKLLDKSKVISKFNIKDMFGNYWGITGVTLGYVGWLLYGGQVSSIGAWIQTSHIVSLSMYGSLFMILWYKHGNYIPALIQMTFCAAVFEFMNIICQIYLYGLLRVSTTSYTVLFGLLPATVLILQGELRFISFRKYGFWIGMSIIFQIFSLATGLLGVSQFSSELGTWTTVLTFSTMVWGSLLSMICKGTNIISFKYIEVDKDVLV